MEEGPEVVLVADAEEDPRVDAVPLATWECDGMAEEVAFEGDEGMIGGLPKPAFGELTQ